MPSSSATASLGKPDYTASNNPSEIRSGFGRLKLAMNRRGIAAPPLVRGAHYSIVMSPRLVIAEAKIKLLVDTIGAAIAAAEPALRAMQQDRLAPGKSVATMARIGGFGMPVRESSWSQPRNPYCRARSAASTSGGSPLAW